MRSLAPKKVFDRPINRNFVLSYHHYLSKYAIKVGPNAIAIIIIIPIIPEIRCLRKYAFDGSFVAFQLLNVFQIHFGNNASNRHATNKKIKNK